MALQRLAWNTPRVHAAWIALAVVGALTTTGCKHHRRTALRPVLTSPGAVAPPCNDCGSGGAATIAPGTAPIIRGGSSTRSLSSEPTFGAPSGSTDSSVPSLEAPSLDSFPTSREGVPPEAPPKATIDSEPDLDPVPSSRSSQSRSLRVPLEDPKNSKAGASDYEVPSLQGPSGKSSPTTWNQDDKVRSASTSGLVKRASVRQQLEPYFDQQGSDDLFFPDKADRPWRYIVLHQSATPSGNYSEIDAEHRRILGFDGCGYHFVIGNGNGSGDGQIEVAQRWVNQKHGVHCQNARKAEIDEYGIGICLIGDFEKAPPTARQIAAAQSLISYLSRRYRIDDDRIETHAELAATPTVCPGGFFPDASVFHANPGRDTLQADRLPEQNRTVPTALRLRTWGRRGEAPSR